MKLFIVRHILLCSAIVMWVAFSVAPTVADDDTLSDVFREILRNPQDSTLNWRYAEIAEDRGALGNALAAYERILAHRPGDEDARRESERLLSLLRAPKTEARLSVGGLYETNAPRRDDSLPSFNDWGLVGRFQIRHDRTIKDRRYRFAGDLYTRWYNRHEAGAFDFASATAAPVFHLGNGWQVATGIGAAYANLKKDPLFGSLYAFAAFESTRPGPLRGVNVRAGYDSFDDRFAGRDAWVFSVDAPLVWSRLVTKGDRLLAIPRYVHNRANGLGHINRFHEAGAQFDYVMPLSTTWRLSGGLSFLATYRWYAGHAPDQANNRRDWRFVPGVRLTVNEILDSDLSVTLGFAREQNQSNDGDKRYKNRTYSLVASWKF